MRQLNPDYFAIVENGTITWGPYPLPHRAPNGMRVKGYISPHDHQLLFDQANLRPVYDEDVRDPLDEDLYKESHRDAYYDPNDDMVVWKRYYEKMPSFRIRLERKLNYKASLQRISLSGIELESTILAEYLKTEAEAREFLMITQTEKENADPEDWPNLNAGLGIDADTLEGVAISVATTADGLNSSLSRTRMERKDAIDRIRNAVTDEDALIIYNSRFSDYNNAAMNIL